MRKVLILAGEGYEDLELWYPKLRFLEEGFEVKLASSDGKSRLSKHGYSVECDLKTAGLNAGNFDAVIIPGGTSGAEKIRMDSDAVNFVKEMHKQNKVVAAICHGPWVLISAFIVKGKKVTCYKGMKDDLIAAGANYEDKAVVVDGNLITSRTPADLPAFVKEILKHLA